MFIPIVPHSSGSRHSENMLLLFNTTKKVVVKDMDFVVKGDTIKATELWIGENLAKKIKKIAGSREIIDYQILPYECDSGFMEQFIVLVTCKKCIWD